MLLPRRIQVEAFESDRAAFVKRMADLMRGERQPVRLERQDTPAEPLHPLRLVESLQAHAAPLDERSARHLLRRTMFGANPTAVTDLIGQPADVAVDAIVDAALARPLPAAPHWADRAPPDYNNTAAFDAYIENTFTWLDEYQQDLFANFHTGGLREKLALFWHNHFVTQQDTYFFAPWVYRYMTVMRTHALGNFKDFVDAVGRDPAMLIYLNGDLNEAGAPNENYARELLELFTMGIFDKNGDPNYSEHDIVDLARALTGWKIDWGRLRSYFSFNYYDARSKTIFGQTGSYNYARVVDLVFEQRAEAIAQFICGKLYTEFVYAAPNQAVVDELARIFIANDFEIAPVVRALLKSEHFFDANGYGAQFKSPVQFMIGFLHETQVEQPEKLFEKLPGLSYFMGQAVLNPPNVAGWPGHRTWLNTATMPARWDVSGYVLFGADVLPALDLTPLAAQIHDPEDPLAAFNLAIALAEHFLPVPLDELAIPENTRAFNGDLIANPLPESIVNGPAYVRTLTKTLLLSVPWYEWHISNPVAPALYRIYVRYLMDLPEYQLA